MPVGIAMHYWNIGARLPGSGEYSVGSFAGILSNGPIFSRALREDLEPMLMTTAKETIDHRPLL